MKLTVEALFSSAHFYEQKKWSPEQNLKKFGACYTQYGHGHNYKLVVTFEAPLAAQEELSSLLKKVCQPLDHQHLNFVLPYFKDKVPTTENIGLYLMKQLQDQSKYSLHSLRLFENNDLWVEVLP